MYKPVQLDAQGRAVRLGAQGKAAWRLGRAERRLGRAGEAAELCGVGEAAELCGAAELLGVPLTQCFNIISIFLFKNISTFLKNLLKAYLNYYHSIYSQHCLRKY